MAYFICGGMVLAAAIIYLFLMPGTKDSVKLHQGLKTLCILLLFWAAAVYLYTFMAFWGYVAGAVLVVASDVIAYFQWRDYFGKSEGEVAHVVKDLPNMRCCKVVQCLEENGKYRFFVEMAEPERNNKRYFTYVAKVRFLEVEQYYMVNRQRILDLKMLDRYQYQEMEYIDISELPMSGFEKATDRQIIQAVGILG